MFGARRTSADAFAAFADYCGCAAPTTGWGADDGTMGTDASAARVACVGGACTSTFGP